MSELSPAAQAVWSSYEAILEYECVVTKTDMKALAAALRAAADQGETFYWDNCPVQAVTVGSLLSIANELEAQ